MQTESIFIKTPAIPFEAFSDTTKIWMYQTGHNLAPYKAIIAEYLDPFIAAWASHGLPVRGAWALYADNILLIAAEETAFDVSGCSTDGLVKTMRTVGDRIGQDFFNRTSFCIANAQGTHFLTKAQVRQLSESETATCLYVDISKDSLKDIRTGWPVALSKSWLFAKTAT